MSAPIKADPKKTVDADIKAFLDLSNEEIFGLSPGELLDIQRSWLRRRFEALHQRIGLVRRICEESNVRQIRDLDDVVPILLPHTLYKSYSAVAFEKRNYAQLTRWLQSVTTHDLSTVRVEGCDSLESWLDAVSGQTPLRPQISSGTSGKISLFPRSTVEERAFLEGVWLKARDPFRDEPALPLRGGQYAFVCPWPVSSGRQTVPTMLGLLKQHVYRGSDERIFTMGRGHQSADELALAGKLRRAEELGESLELNDQEQALREAVAARARAAPRSIDEFIDRAIIGLRGEKVHAAMIGPAIYQLAVACERRGIVVEWDSGSIMNVGGGSKGFALPDDWEARCRNVFPCHWVDGYGMSEVTTTAQACPVGHLHFYPWAILFVLDPKSGQPLPRSGIQSGRMAVFDLMAETHWGGIVTGDRTTVDWEGDCSCGRRGPFLRKGIDRIASSGGDDKISCAKTPGAYERLEQYSLNMSELS